MGNYAAGVSVNDIAEIGYIRVATGVPAADAAFARDIVGLPSLPDSNGEAWFRTDIRRRTLVFSHGVEVNLGTDPLLPPTATVPPTATATDAPEPTVTPTVVTRTPTPTPTAFPAGYWHGIWETECEYLLCGQINFTHDAAQNVVTGTFAEGAGTLVGIFESNLLTGTWSASGETGSFDFWITPDGTTWYGNWNKSYYWCGYRTGGEAPTPCGVATWSGDWLTDCSNSCETITFTQNGEFVEGVYAGGERVKTLNQI